MTTFALVHGAWGSGWHWASIPERLRALGHDVVAPDLPCDDPAAHAEHYAAVMADALGDRDEDVVVVGFSLGGLTAPLVAATRPVRAVVYVAAMLAEPGKGFVGQRAEGPAILPEYLAGVRAEDGTSRWTDFDVYLRVGYNGRHEDEVRERFRRLRPQGLAAFVAPCPLDALPDVPTRYVLCTQDRIMDNAYWPGAVRERLGVEPVELASSHTPMLDAPGELTSLITAPV